jgi:hypothetical protein
VRKNASHGLQTIFGKKLERQGWSYAVEKGQGNASLGILRIQRRSDVQIDRYGKLRLRLSWPGGPAFLPVTDLRFVEADHKTIKTKLVDDVSARMKSGVEVLLMLGLARAFLKDGDDRERHWLQVNGICMADRPLGDRP